jgi:hypothetical protein
MATTSGNLMAGKANGGQYGLKAKLAAGAAVLGCAAALAFGGLRPGGGGHAPAMAPAAPVARTNSVERQQFLAWNMELPTGGALSVEAQRFLALNTELPDGRFQPVSVERQQFLEWNTVLPEGRLPAAPISVERQHFLELNTQLPDGGVVAPTPSDRSTHR